MTHMSTPPLGPRQVCGAAQRLEPAQAQVTVPLQPVGIGAQA